MKRLNRTYIDKKVLAFRVFLMFVSLATILWAKTAMKLISGASFGIAGGQTSLDQRTVASERAAKAKTQSELPDYEIPAKIVK